MTSTELHVIPVPAFRDNYLWVFHRPGDTRAYVVDPGDARPVEAALAEHGLDLAGILITHHHPDHTGGIDRLLQDRDLPVYGPSGGSVPQVTRPLAEGDRAELQEGLAFQVMEVPGHTLDHIVYFCPTTEPPTLFCGDTLFAGGCGRLFEGTAEQMYNSLSKLAALPDATRVYCAHEYTLANLAFADAVDGGNDELQKRIAAERAKRERSEPTVPSTLGLEKSTNPFLRCDTDAIRQTTEAHFGRTLSGGPEVLGAVREWKDSF
ncbi:hydroxyacylglutathione hydrolase [Gilvimarinus sp. F26214L]|uniref:hydroxyacylglutathione hydrolase n=1 Tax=Gilvimarinus sp. DZF01 TaxID=3461371 RepID=UPI00404686DF